MESAVIPRYIQLTHSFQGCWIATAALLQNFTASPWWQKSSALQMHSHIGGYAERTTWGIQIFQAPEGRTSHLVPYDKLKARLEPVARIQHLRNGYSQTSQQQENKLFVEDVISDS